MEPVGDIEHAVRSMLSGLHRNRRVLQAAANLSDGRKIDTVHGSHCMCHTHARQAVTA